METMMKQITDRIYLLRDEDNSNAYLIVGEDKALVIDTMNGFESVKEAARQVTDLPLMLIHTHGHVDHIGGDGYFGEAYIDPQDIPVAKAHWKMIQEETHKKPPFDCEIVWKPFQPGDSIDLGGYVLETYEVPGHTQGGLCLLSRQDRIFIAGDAITEHIWMHLEESRPIEELIASLEALQPIRSEFDYILNGHAPDTFPPTAIDALIRAAKEILAGETKDDYDYECFGKMYKAHRLYPGEDGRVIVYDPSR